MDVMLYNMCIQMRLSPALKKVRLLELFNVNPRCNHNCFFFVVVVSFLNKSRTERGL